MKITKNVTTKVEVDVNITLEIEDFSEGEKVELFSGLLGLNSNLQGEGIYNAIKEALKFHSPFKVAEMLEQMPNIK